MTNDGNHTYQYDAENRLIKIDGGSTAQYAYGPQGERVSKIAGGVTTYFYWGIGEKVNGSWTRLYVQGLGGKLVEYSDGGTKFFVTNHLGTIAARMDLSGQTMEIYRYLPYGERYAGNQTPHQYTGKERDAESGLDYFGARYYASSHGRWMTVDPALGKITKPKTLNRYSYALSNPLVYADPDGRSAICHASVTRDYTWENGEIELKDWTITWDCPEPEAQPVDGPQSRDSDLDHLGPAPDLRLPDLYDCATSIARALDTVPLTIAGPAGYFGGIGFDVAAAFNSLISAARHGEFSDAVAPELLNLLSGVFGGSLAEISTLGMPPLGIAVALGTSGFELAIYEAEALSAPSGQFGPSHTYWVDTSHGNILENAVHALGELAADVVEALNYPAFANQIRQNCGGVQSGIDDTIPDARP